MGASNVMQVKSGVNGEETSHWNSLLSAAGAFSSATPWAFQTKLEEPWPWMHVYISGHHSTVVGSLVGALFSLCKTMCGFMVWSSTLHLSLLTAVGNAGSRMLHILTKGSRMFKASFLPPVNLEPVLSLHPHCHCVLYIFSRINCPFDRPQIEPHGFRLIGRLLVKVIVKSYHLPISLFLSLILSSCLCQPLLEGSHALWQNFLGQKGSEHWAHAGSWVREREGASAGVRCGEREQSLEGGPREAADTSLLDSFRRMKVLLPMSSKGTVTLNVFSLINRN